jgi:hypothetical protein
MSVCAAAVVVAGLGLVAPAVQASPVKTSNKNTVFCAYADDPWAPAAVCLDNPLPNRLPLPW